MSAAAIDGDWHGPAATVAPWRGLLRASARQHRTSLIAMAGYYGVCAALLLVTGPLVRAYPLSVVWHVLLAVPFYLLLAAPAVAGAGLGVPIVAREIETGTSRLGWVQGAGRGRWLLGQAAPVVVLLAIGSTITGALVSWRFSDALLTTSGSDSLRFFDLVMPASIGWTVAAFALGVFLGAVLRRTIPAMLATAAGYAALLIHVDSSWRAAYLPPVVRAGRGLTSVRPLLYPPNRAFMVSRWLGRPDGRPFSNTDYAHGANWLIQQHARWWISYQPDSRYLPFQLIEFGWLIALAAVLVGVAIVVIRRRPA